ncbi:hypothetical protein N7523_001712 [Penicillium sp. IBT 18751x]|nr:hypothetical protein N7523_001712 [Penicillium sp. IBT 18751x]
MDSSNPLSFHQRDFDGVANNMPQQNIIGRPYRCLDSVLPYLRNILSPVEASEMLEVYFSDNQDSAFKSSSPYMLAHVLHPSSVLHSTEPRLMSPALLTVIFFCVTQTADMRIFDTPGARERMSVDLYRLSLNLLEHEDPDNYFRTSDGWQFHNPRSSSDSPSSNLPSAPDRQAGGKFLLPRQLGSTDFILAVAILTLAVSGGHYKADCLKWRDKLIRLVRASGLTMEDQDIDLGPVFCGLYNGDSTFKRWFIAKEERRRLFWLVYCLDRHLALSFNMNLNLPEGTFRVRTPLPESMWKTLHAADLNGVPACPLGPPTQISGTGFFEYFLPLARVLGHIIDIHHARNHPTLGVFVSQDAVRRLESMISQREQELTELKGRLDISFSGESSAKVALVEAYSTYLLHVFYILLHGKWDPISMIEDEDDWITSESFLTCASHALIATGVVSKILALDPEMAFMPYLFGIYLLQGSFILLLFLDRMPELGPNRSVEEVCETIIRAHEVSVVTLDTTFQVKSNNLKNLFIAHESHTEKLPEGISQPGPHSWDEHKVRRRELLSLYRWTPLAHGLAY